MKAIEIGGMADHVHVLMSLPSTLSIAKGMQLIKAALPNGCMKRSPNTGAVLSG